jgi:hypothetical protein
MENESEKECLNGPQRPFEALPPFVTLLPFVTNCPMKCNAIQCNAMQQIPVNLS